MLDPNTRSLYTAALTPPPGMVVDAALGTTFSLDPATLLSVPAHLALLGGDRGHALRDGIAVLESVRRLSDRITVYAQRGRLQVPNPPHVLYGLLESMVVEVTARRRGGSFHPKLWLIRFLHAENADAVLLRLLILSRNVTADRSWDVALTLEGRPTGRYRVMNRTLGMLIAQLPTLAVGEVDVRRSEQAADLGDELRRTEWQLPPGFDEVSFHVLGMQRRTWKPEGSSRFAVISPFCSDQALKNLAETTRKPDVLISRSETLDALATDTRACFGRCLTLDDAAQTEDGEAVETAEDRDTCGLHAKVYVLERGWNTHLVLGSANATDVALLAARNVEVLAELVGKRSRVGGIDRLLDDEGLGEVLVEYDEHEPRQGVDRDRQAAERALGAARDAIARADLSIECTEGPKHDEWHFRLVVDGTVEEFEGISSARAWPISVMDDRAVDLGPLFDGGRVDLGTFAAASLTGLVAVELRAELHCLHSRFVLNIPVTGLPAERDSAVLQTVVRNRDGFFRYLLLLLGDLGDSPPPSADDSRGAASSWTFDGSGSMPLLEEMVRAYSRDPQRLHEVGRVVRRLMEGDEAGEIVPEEFLDTWAVFERALERRDG